MDIAAVTRKYGATVLGTLGVVLWLVALYLLGASTENSALFAKWLPWILLINIAGLFTLFALLATKLTRLVRDYRRHVPGSRLKGRTVAIFSVLAVAPILIVYYFSLQFINRGIDSWFEIEVSQGLKDTRELSHAALEVRVREFLQHTQVVAKELSPLSDFELIGTLDRERRESTALEFTVVGPQTRIIATSSDRPMDTLPIPATDEMMLQVRRGRPYVSIDTDAYGGYVIRAATPLDVNGATSGARVLIALYPVPQQLSQLADTVQRSYANYAYLVQLRQPLKSTFVLILSFVVLMSLIAAVYGAFFAAQRLVQPVQDLIAGTRAVAKGNYDTKLPLPSRDELGFLVTSFNDMTKRLGKAREETRRSQQAVEAERAGLAVILARLSTGVVSLEADLTVRTANQAASAILGVDLEAAVGMPFDAAISDSTLFNQFLSAVRLRLGAAQHDWREQIELLSDSGKRVLMCACTALPNDIGAPGMVLVFDDITTLLQAQRDAAWGEVARRLAHEIKNPLTPIQLSAERIQRKFSGSMNAEDAQILERATHTIVAQVEAMKQMVNAFSEYARAPAMHFSRFDVNQLITEVVDLYRVQASAAELKLTLCPTLPSLSADRIRIRQILNNLVTNSIEALEGNTGACVEIETHLVEDGPKQVVAIVVTDNGPGFARDLIGTIFDPYVTSKPKGTGLGLAIVKKIVEEHGGRIEADNLRTGGARVRILLPGENPRSVSGVNPEDRIQERTCMTASRILVVDDEADIRGLLKEILSEEGYDVDVAADAGQARSSRASQVPDLVLLDIWMPDTDGITLLREWSVTDGYDCPVVMMSGHGTVETAVEATRLGAFDFVEKPLSLTKLLRTVERALDSGRRKKLSERTTGSALAVPIGKSKVTQALRDQVQHAASSSSPVLLVGELGSGREAYARFLHSLSPRAHKPFFMVVAASLSGDPAVALFGRERDGKIELGACDQASGGSLFINGLEDLNVDAQRALTGAIEQNGYTRVGGRERLPLNVRWISSAQEGFELRPQPEPFRRDLLANLNVITLRVPPLREYAEDVPDLLRFYVDRLVDDQHLPLRRFSVAAQNRLRNYPWPGNVGELKNLVQRVLILGAGEEIRLDEIERELAVKLAVDEPLVKQDLLALPLREAREQFERAYLQQQLLLCNGKVGQLAKRVGMERTHLYRKLRALGVDFRQLGED